MRGAIRQYQASDGTASWSGRSAFLEKLTRNTRDFCAMLEKINSLQMFSVEGAAAQDKRAAGRFAFIGLAGELATEYGLTGWQEVEAPKPRESDHPR